jgi:hypothetical protein
MIGGQRPYLSYLLRLWLVDDEGPTWRASLESASTAERRGFTNLESLFTFLRAQAHDLAATAQWECEADAAAADAMPETAPDE